MWYIIINMYMYQLDVHLLLPPYIVHGWNSCSQDYHKNVRDFFGSFGAVQIQSKLAYSNKWKTLMYSASIHYYHGFEVKYLNIDVPMDSYNWCLYHKYCRGFP